MSDEIQKLEGYEYPPPRNAGGVSLCVACRRTGICQLGCSLQQEDDRDGDCGVRFELACSEGFEGGPGVAHGGWIAAIFDEMLGRVTVMQNQMTVTGELTVRFLKPVPIERSLVGRAWVVRRDFRRWLLAGDIRLGSSGAVLSTSEGTFVDRDNMAHFGGFQGWLATQGDDADPVRATDSRNQA